MLVPLPQREPQRRPEATFAYWIGSLLVASGVIHFLVWLAGSSSLSGAVSWRKPILFGVSAGATVISMGWLVGKFERRRGDFALLAAFSVAMFVEVGLITMQQWRGVPSHFNRSTPVDATVLAWVECLVIFATVVIADFTRRSFRPLPTSSDMALAIRGGMSLLLLSCLLGFALVAYGNHQLTLGRAPEVFGAAGVMKFPHGVPMHAIQFLPILAWVLKKLGAPSPQRRREIACALLAVLAFTAFSLLQTLTGRARFELWWLSSVVLAAAAVLISIPLGIRLSQGVSRLLDEQES